MVSQQCKYELKANVDRVQREKGISRHQAIALVADECDLIKETARKMDQRARKELGQTVPKESSQSKKTDTYEPKVLGKENHGGKRNGAGRPKMPSSLDGKIEDIIKDIDSLKYKLIKVNGFLGDIQSKKLQLAFKKELECLQGPMGKILKDYQEAGY